MILRVTNLLVCCGEVNIQNVKRVQLESNVKDALDFILLFYLALIENKVIDCRHESIRGAQRHNHSGV